VALCVALAGCAAKPAPREGGAPSSKAEKARKDAEALAVGAVNTAATAQAKAVPETAVQRDISWLGGHFTIDRETGKPAVHLTKAGTAAKAPVVVSAPAPKSAPPTPAPVVVAKGPPTPKTAPRPGPAAVFRERVVSTLPYATEAEAEEDALTQARDLVEQKLAALDPPVRHKTSIGEVKAEFVRKDSRTVRPPDAEEKEAFALYGVSGNLVYVEYDVEVTADQVRELRAQERVSAGLRVLGVLVAVALAGFLFLRADEWTRGYLTSWLALAAVTLGGGAVAALLCI
jgi:hypothetical protein